MNKFKSKVMTSLAIVLALPLLVSSISKILDNQGLVKILASWNTLLDLRAIGWLELALACLFIYERTRYVGFFLLCSYLGGAIAIEAQKGTFAFVNVLMLGTYWLLIYLQNNYLFFKSPHQKALHGVVLRKK